MNPFFQIIIIAYLFLVVPFLSGVLEAGIFRRERKTASELFTNGYLWMLAVFYVLAVLFVKQMQPLSMLAYLWVAVTLVVTVLALLVGRKRIIEVVGEIKQFWIQTEPVRQENDCVRGKWILLFVFLMSVVGAVFFTKPDVFDRTVEVVQISVATDSMYLYDVYSGYLTGTIDAQGAKSPIEMLYAVGAVLSGMDASLLIYRVLPFSILLFFFLSLWRMGKLFFRDTSQQIVFELVAILLYWMTTYMQGRSLVTGIFLNGWNGLTLLSCVILPLVFVNCVQLMQAAEFGLRAIPNKIERICRMPILFLAGQLAHEKGGFYVALMLFLSIAVILIKGGYRYGITSGRFKKRI